MAATEEQVYIGQAVPRREDARLITGQGTYVDNYAAPGLLHLVMARSPIAHARIKSIDVSQARSAPGVVEVLTGEDLKDAWPNGLPCIWPVSDDIKMPPHLPLSIDKVRYVGDGVAVVVAESRAQAKDAIELIEVDYEPLPAVTDVEKALDAGAPLVHDDVAENRCYTWSLAGRRARQGLRRGGPYGEGPVPPAEADPGPDGAARRRVRGLAGDRRRHGRHVDAGAAHHAHRLHARARDPRGQDPGDRAGRRRRLRLEDGRVRRGHARHHLRPQTRPLGEVDRGALRSLPRHGPRPRPHPGDRARRGREREDHGRQGASHGRDGRLPPGRHARDPAARRLALRRVLRRRRIRLPLHRRVHEHDPDRRVPRRRPSRRPRTRSSGRWTSWRPRSARIRSRSAG